MYILTQAEFELLKLLQTSRSLNINSYDSEQVYDVNCQLAFELRKKGYLFLSKPLTNYNKDMTKINCLASNFQLTPKAINQIVPYNNYGSYLRAQPSNLSVSFPVYVIIVILVMLSLSLILLI